MEETVPFEVRSLAYLILETGFRLPELIKLEWRDIDLATGLIRNPYYGGGERLTTDALTVFFDVLSATEPPFEPFIFPEKSTGKPMSSKTAHELLRRHGPGARALGREFKRNLGNRDWFTAYRMWDVLG